MDPRHAVDRVGAHDAQVGHVDLLLAALLDQRHAALAVGVAGETLGDALAEGQREHMMKSLGKVVFVQY